MPHKGVKSTMGMSQPVATLSAQESGFLDPPRVLVVDDNESNLAVFQAILVDSSFELVCAQSGVEAMRHLLHSDFAAILLDMNMPTMDGIQTAQLIRERERSRDVPIIFITAYQPDQAQILAGYASGAVDYLVKPVSPEVLKSKVRIFVDLFRKTRQIEWQARQLRGANARLQQEQTQREEAERNAAFEREERQSVTLSSIADAVIATDQDSVVTSLNPVAEALTGRRSAEAKGQSLREVLNLAQDGGEAMEKCVQRALEEDVVCRSEASHALTQKGVKRYFDYSVSPVHDRLGKVVGAVLILHDITARTEVEMERARTLKLEQEARRAAERASRARDEFLSVISHELRTPLNAIVGWTHILRTNGSKQDHMERAVDAIQRSAMAQKKLIEDLLDMSHIINGKFDLQRAPIDLALVVESAVDTLRPSAEEKTIKLHCDLADMRHEAVADRSRLQQVVWNVLANAIKFTPSGGSVLVRLEPIGDRARIMVSDTGQGIAPDFLPHIFEAFRQADSSTTRRAGGLGLGLAISRQLISAHGGEIEAHSAGLGRGTSVSIMLPLRMTERAIVPEQSPLPIATAGENAVATESLDGVRILVVDDDPDTLTLVSIALRSEGAELRSVPSAAAAMQAMQDWNPEVLLSDISMPEEDGYSLMRRLRALPPERGGDIVAFALTAMASEEDRVLAMNAGFDAHVPKPFDLDALARLIHKTLHARSKTVSA
jgi:PAS domain S-box-containing protein